jgi:hypothetical protein
MSLKAGGGNFGTTFSTLTYSAEDMIAVLGGEEWRVRDSVVVWRVKFCGCRKRKHLLAPATMQGPIVIRDATA